LPVNWLDIGLLVRAGAFTSFIFPFLSFTYCAIFILNHIFFLTFAFPILSPIPLSVSSEQVAGECIVAGWDELTRNSMVSIAIAFLLHIFGGDCSYGYFKHNSGQSPLSYIFISI